MPVNQALRRRYLRTGAWRYHHRFDALYSVRTRKWLEEKCGDAKCQFCTTRPKLAPRRIRAAT